ncbi:TetR family transcriptional regulator [Streptomyces sp. NPDC004658]|uniref:TetR/AcrR family transcriptional regulator n=1 Tax=Streptomyces sp. NPDC004658 TaxID=3154672 RepID=UPI0033BEC90B
MDATETTSTAAESRRARRESTRAAILQAAREAWAERAYDDIGLRDIAGRAGVTAAMVNRYFGTKEGLFREAVGTRDPSPPGLNSIDPAEFGPTLAALLLGGGHQATSHEVQDAYDPLLILLRSAASHSARPVLRDYIEQTVIPPLADYFDYFRTDGPAARERAVLTLSLVLGINVLGRMLEVEPLKAAEGDPTAGPGLKNILGAMLQAAADTPLQGETTTDPEPDRSASR